MIFDCQIPSRYLFSAPTLENIRAINKLTKAARCAFPNLEIDVYLASDSVNAQAFMRGRDRHIRVYGGLLRHKAMAFDGLALALTHEAGHHFGGPPYHFYFDWMSTECQADYWAIVHGIPEMQKLLPNINLIAAIEQISGVMRSYRKTNDKTDDGGGAILDREKALARICATRTRRKCYCGGC